MTGTFINVTAIIIGGLLGIFFGARLSDNIKNTVIAGMGIFTAAIGFEMFFENRESAHCAGCINCWRASGRVVGTRKPCTITGDLVGKKINRQFRRKFQPFCTRFSQCIIVVLHWTDGGSWLD